MKSINFVLLAKSCPPKNAAPFTFLHYYAGLEITPVQLSRTTRFPLGQVTLSEPRKADLLILLDLNFLRFNMILWSYIVDKMEVNVQGVEQDLRQMVKSRMTSIFGLMNY